MNYAAAIGQAGRRLDISGNDARNMAVLSFPERASTNWPHAREIT